MSNLQVRQLRAAVTDPAVSASECEALAHDVSTFLLAGADPKAAFISSEGFLLTSSFTQMSEKQKSASSSSSSSPALSSGCRDMRRTLVAALMPTGKCGILTATAPPELAGNLSKVWAHKISELSSSVFANVVTRALRWLPTSATATASALSDAIPVDTGSIGAVISAANSLVEALDGLAASAEPLPVEDPRGVQLLVFLVCAKLEGLMLQKAAQLQRTALDACRKKVCNAVADFESRRGVAGSLRPFCAFAALWFMQRSTVEAKSLAGDAFAIIAAARLEADRQKITSTTAPSATANSRRRQRDDEEPDQEHHHQQQKQQDRFSAEITWVSFEQKMKEHMETATSVSQTARQESESIVGAIPAEIEFSDNSTSSTAREVDRLVPLLRNVLFSASPFEQSGESHLRAMSVAFDRRRNDGSSSEARSIVPTNATAATGESNKKAQPTVLERLAQQQQQQ